jgi:Tol biopolymer transport system component
MGIELRRRARAGVLEGVMALALLAPAAPAGHDLRLSAPLVAGGDVVQMEVAPHGRRVVYRADQDADDVFELFSVSLDGGLVVRLNAPLVAGGDVGADFVHCFRISPDGAHVVYWADQDEDEVFELFSVPIDGSAPPVQLNGPLVAGGDVLSISSSFPSDAFAPITPDGTRVLYVADQEEDEVYGLYCAPIDGSAPALALSGPLVPGGDVYLGWPPYSPNPFWPQIDPHGQRAVYRADQDVDGFVELFSVPLDRSEAPARLDSRLGPDGAVHSARISPDGAWVLYVEFTGGISGASELYRAPLAGTPAHARRTDTRNRLSLPLGPFRDVGMVSISADSTRVAYQANPTGGSSYELFGVPLDGGPSTPLSRLSDGAVLAHGITRGDERVVYLAGNDEAFDSKLFSVPLDGSADRTQISTLSALGYVTAYELTPDASRALYLYFVGPAVELHSTPTDGSAAAVKLDPPGTSVIAFRLNPAGREVVYLQRPAVGGAQELYAVPVDGSRTARRLNPPLAPGRDVGRDAPRDAFRVTTGGRVLYLADQDTDDAFELYLTFIGPPVRRLR